jgi:hypothetical protein
VVSIAAPKSLWLGRKRKLCFYEGASDRKGVRREAGYLCHVMDAIRVHVDAQRCSGAV